MKIYVCRHCGNIITHLTDSGVPVVCCGEPMELLEPGTVEASLEKHIPAVTVEGDVVFVKIGEVPHPMVTEHFIEWIILETNHGIHVKWLKPGENAEAVFHLSEGEKKVCVYEFCNIHGLWKAD